jgi:ligand-binding sensor domain-containing protein
MRGPDREGRRGVLRLALLAALVLVPVGESAAERLPVKAYTTDNGLAHNRVKRIVQDSRGFVWFCTADGLSRFDGHQFTNYRVDEGLPAPSINDLVETTDGVYWVATNEPVVDRDSRGTLPVSEGRAFRAAGASSPDSRLQNP